MTDKKPTEAPKPFDYVNKRTGRRYRVGGCLLDEMPSSAPEFSATSKYMSKELPASVDLRKFMTPVEDQSDSSSCAGNALASAYEFLIKKNRGKNIDVSRLFIYYNSRLKDGYKEYNMKDAGTQIVHAVEALAEYGCCKEQSFPFDAENLNRKPPDECYTEAKTWRIKSGMQLNGDLNELKACLTEGYPFVFSLAMYKSFYQAETNGGHVPMPNLDEGSNDGFLGGHALIAVGYSDRSKCFIIQNSWGEKWGDKGYCYIPYEYMCGQNLCRNWHSIRILTDDDEDHHDTDDNKTTSNEEQFWKPDDSHDYYHSIWHDKTIEAESSDGGTLMTYILWIDSDKPELEPVMKPLTKDPRVHITYQPNFTEAMEYILLNIEKIKSLPQLSVFQIVCRGYYKSENKNAFDLLPFLTRHKLEYVPITAITGHKPAVLNHFKEQASTTGINDWNSRIYVTSSHADLITRINGNLIDKCTNQHQN